LLAPADCVRRVRFVFTAVLMSVLLYFLVTLAQVWTAGRSDSFATSDRAVDAVVVLGAAQYDGRPSPQLQARLDHALRLWQRGAAPIVVVTGGKQQGDRFTEAESGREYLIDAGVSPESILVEPTGTSTFDSLQSLRNDSGVDTITRVVIVSDPYHVLRASLVARELGFDAISSATRTSVTRGSDAFARNVREALGIMVGRVVGFRQLESWLQ
jgi:vancomycin permeability regulator SanA